MERGEFGAGAFVELGGGLYRCVVITDFSAVCCSCNGKGVVADTLTSCISVDTIIKGKGRGSTKQEAKENAAKLTYFALTGRKASFLPALLTLDFFRPPYQ